MGVHAGQLDLKSDLRLVQEYRRSLLPCLEQARRPTLDHHVYRSSGLGVWVLISENLYYCPLPAAPASVQAQFRAGLTLGRFRTDGEDPRKPSESPATVP